MVHSLRAKSTVSEAQKAIILNGLRLHQFAPCHQNFPGNVTFTGPVSNSDHICHV